MLWLRNENKIGHYTLQRVGVLMSNMSPQLPRCNHKLQFARHISRKTCPTTPLVCRPIFAIFLNFIHITASNTLHRVFIYIVHEYYEKNSFYRCNKCDILNQYVWPNAVVPGSYNGEIEYLTSWLNKRLDWLDLNINKIIILARTAFLLIDAIQTVFIVNLFKREYNQLSI